MNEAVSLTIQNLSVPLGGRTVIHHISSKLEGGHLVALVGPNGVGKTTLLRAIAGLIASSGAIHVDGLALSDLPLRERAKIFGYLPQGHVIHWPLRVRDVVALGRFPHGATDPVRLPEADAVAVARAIKAADVTSLADRRVTELSGGERSRVALARVLAVEAPVVLADEPTASLDPRYQLDIMNVLRSVANGGSLVVVVTHDLSLAARFADTVLVLSDGRLVAQGSPEHALSETIMEDVFRVDSFRANFRDRSVILPWAGI